MKNTNLLKSALILFFVLCSFSQVWGSTFTVNSSTTSSDALFSVSETMTNYTYSSTWIASDKLIKFVTGASITVTNVTGATITAITAEGVADNNNNKTVCFTASDGTTTAAGTSASWNNRKSTTMTTGQAFNSTDVNNFKCGAGQTYTFTNNSSDSYAAGARIVITYTSTLPTSLTNGATTSSSQVVSWTAPYPAPANGYLVAYSTSSTAPGNSVTSTTGSYTVTAISAGTTSTTLSELSGSTTYNWWVRSKNARGNSSWVAGSSFTTESANTYFYRGDDNDWGATAMTSSSGGLYEYIASTSSANKFKIALTADSWDYNKDYNWSGFFMTDQDINLGDWGGDDCYIWDAPASYYIIVFKPNTSVNSSSNPHICVSTTLPDDSPSGLAATKTVYLDPGVWETSNAKYAICYVEHNGEWSGFMSESPCFDGVYQTTIPAWVSNVEIVRFSSDATDSDISYEGGKCWNYSGHLSSMPSGAARFTVYQTGASWNDLNTSNWSTPDLPTYTISYAKGTNGTGSRDSETKTCGVDFTLPSSGDFTRTGYTQTGWATSDGGSKAYDLGGSYTTDAAQTFYPVWTINNYNLTWNLGGGTTTSAGTGIASGVSANTTSSVTYGTSLTAPTVTRTGYTFSSWSPTVASTMPASNTTYTAQWTVNKYSVTHTLSNVTATSGATGSNAATYGTNYTATFSRILEYNLPASVTVTAGGSNITTYCTWNASTGSLTIPGARIVGNIVITVSGTAVVCPERGESPTTLYSAVVAATSAQSIPAGASNQRLTPSQATVTGGFMSVYNGQSSAKDLIAKQNNEWWFCETNANTYFRIDLDCALQKGDIITADCYASGEARGIWISSATSRPSSAPACAGTTTSEGEVINYKVTTSDEYYGKQTLYIYRATSNSTYFNNVKVTRPAACTDAAAVTSFTCSSQTQTSLTYTWTKATGATAYTAKLWDNSSCTGETVDTKDLGNVATVTFSGLDAGNTYYCKVTSLGDGDTYCEEGETTSAVSGTTSACTAISPTFSYPFMTVAKGITIIPDIDAKGSSGTVSYASSATSVITNDCYVAEASGTATLTATVAAKGAYCEGVVTSGTFTAVADQTGLIRQALTTGDNTWGTPAAPTKSDATNITSTTAIAATGITIDDGKGNTNNDGQTAKVGSLSAYDASKYMSLGFTVRTGKKVNVNAIYIPVQPVTSNVNNFKAVLSDASTSITGTISDVPNGKLTYIKFDSYGTVRGNVTLKLYAYGWTNGYRLGKGIVIDGTVVSETYTVTLENQGATTAGAASINVDFETVTGNISSNLPAKPGYNFGGYYTEVDGEGVQFIAPDGTFNSSITDYTDASKRWIATSGVTLYAKWTPAALTFTGASNSSWSNSANWTPACVPTINHDVTLLAPVTVDVTTARVKSMVIYNDGDTKTGQLEINAGMELVVATTLKKTTDGSNRIATGVNDIIINSTSGAGLGALVMGSHDGTNKATVNFTTRAAGTKDDNTSIAQYVGTPFNDETNILHNWYNSWIYGIAYEGGSIDWVRINEGEGMIPFRGYCVFSADGANHVYWEQGTLNATTDRTISGLNWQSGLGTANLNNENLLANSWMAPIYIKAMESSDFVNADATIYIFNSTSAKAYESGSFAGNYDSYTVNTADEVIPAMQSFSVFTTGTNASVTLDYSRIVYEPAVAGTAAPQPNKVISRERKNDNEANKLRIFVRTESGLGDMLYMWEREDFSEAFENGWDGRKMYGESYAPQLYAITPDGAMAVNCVPTYEGVLIGFRAGTDEQTYTFSFEYDADAEPLYLYDKYADVYTRVLSGNTYQFVANDYDAHARFSLTHYMPGVATGIEASATGDQNPEIRCQKILLNERILILRDGKLYDVTGKTVK